MKRRKKNTPQPPATEPSPSPEEPTESGLERGADESRPGYVVFGIGDFFDLDEESQRSRVRQMLEMLSPNPEVRARARKKAEGEDTQ